MSPLPDGWQHVVLNDVLADEPAAITDGPFGSNLARRHYTTSGARVIRLGNIGDGVFIDEPAFISMGHYARLIRHDAQPGDLVVASLGEVLPRACLVPDGLGPAIVKADCIRVRFSERVDPKWVLYAMQSPAVRAWAVRQVHGVGRPRLGLKVIRETPLPLPPKGIQRRIVAILEDHLSRLDAATALIDASLARFGGMFIALLRRQRDSLLDEGAQLSTIGDLATTALGKMLDAKSARGEETPYLRNQNVRWGSFDLTSVKSVPLTREERRRFALADGDILVCEGGEPGRCAVWRGAETPMVYQKALHRVRLSEPAAHDPDFLALMLEEYIHSGRADHLLTGTTIKHLPQEKLRVIALPVPSKERQLEAVASIAAVGAESSRLAAELTVAIQKTRALRRATLAAAFSGKLTSKEHVPESTHV